MLAVKHGFQYELEKHGQKPNHLPPPSLIHNHLIYAQEFSHLGTKKPNQKLNLEHHNYVGKHVEHGPFVLSLQKLIPGSDRQVILWTQQVKKNMIEIFKFDRDKNNI